MKIIFRFPPRELIFYAAHIKYLKYFEMKKIEKIFEKVLTNQGNYDKIQIVKVIFIEFEIDFHF